MYITISTIVFPDFERLTVNCRLPSVDNILHHSEEDSSADGQHGINCTKIDQKLFDLMNQPFMHNQRITRDIFDSLPCTLTEIESTNDDIVITGQTKTKRSVSARCKNDDNKNVKETVNLQCHLCNKKLKTDNDLKEHLEVHKGTRKVCTVPLCIKTFTRQQSLSLHLRGNCHVDANGNQIKHVPTEMSQNQNVEPCNNESAKKTENPSKNSVTDVKASEENAPQNGQKEKESIKLNSKPRTKPEAKKTSSEGSQPKSKPEAKKTSSECSPSEYETDSDTEFNALPLPTPGAESHEFYDALVKTKQLEGGKVLFICRKCSRTATRKADVKRHWKSTCPKNPFPEIHCRHCLPLTKHSVRGKSNLVCHLQSQHSLVGEHVCLRCQSLFTDVKFLQKHNDKCKSEKGKLNK